MRPLVHTGDSLNIAFYAEQVKPPGYVWAEYGAAAAFAAGELEP